jgi:sugar phosphate isomerase/epimerase
MLLCNNLKDYLRVLKAVRGLKTTLDIGHSNTGDVKPSEFLKEVKGTIMDMHVHDNDESHDQHMCLGEGSIDFVKLFKTCKQIKYYGPFTMEIFPYDNILKGRKRLLNYWKKA